MNERLLERAVALWIENRERITNPSRRVVDGPDMRRKRSMESVDDLLAARDITWRGDRKQYLAYERVIRRRASDILGLRTDTGEQTPSRGPLAQSA